MSDKESLSARQKSLQGRLKFIRDYCGSMTETIAIAESVTAGCLQLILSSAEGAQDFFQGGITVYNCAQKAIHLNVEPIFANSCDGVDEAIAVKMAGNVCNLFRSQIGISITGYATKVPEEDINDLYAYVAIVRNGKTIHQAKLESDLEGIEAQWFYAASVIDILSKVLTDTE